MLWTIAIILLVLWLIGWVGFHVLGAAIHILVILAIIFIVVALVKGLCFDSASRRPNYAGAVETPARKGEAGRLTP